MAPQVQTSYQEKHNFGHAGLLVNPSTCDVDSFQFRGTTKGKFGYAVQRHSGGDKHCQAAVASTWAFVGLLVIDKTLQPVQADEFVEGDIASVLYRGVAWVEVLEAVSPGDLVTINRTTGQFGTGVVGVDGGIILAGGTGYAGTDDVTVEAGEAYQVATFAANTVTVASGVITGVGAPTAANRGSGYLREPRLAISGAGSGARVVGRLTRIPIVGASYLTSAAAGELAQLRLPGNLGAGAPSAIAAD